MSDAPTAAAAPATTSVPKFVRDKHVDYILSLEKRDKDSFESFVTEHLRMSGLYWGITALDVLKQADRMGKDKIIAFILACQHENGTITLLLFCYFICLFII